MSPLPPGAPPSGTQPQSHDETEFQLLKRAAQGEKTEESESNWLVSYADMMTLLVGFFVLLLSFSKIDASAFERVKRETTKVFGGEYQVPFHDVATKIRAEITQQNVDDQVAFQQTDAGVEISFRGALFFELGKADLRLEAKTVLEKIIPIVLEKAKDFGVVIEGHTDNIPTHNDLFASNWELSSVRATTVLRLFEERGFPRDRLKAVGFADTRPSYPNEDEQGNAIPENQAQNRRVVLKVLRE